jgi:hypothetical protein
MKGEHGMSEYGSGDGPRDGDGFNPPPPPPPPPFSGSGSYETPFEVTRAIRADIISSPDRGPKRSRLPILLAMATVIVIVLAGGAVALISKNKTAKAGDLTKLVPAGAYGYIQVDLRQESSAGLFGYLSHFPGSPATKPEAKKGTFRDNLLGSVFSKADNVDYGRDIQPWLGNEAGVAVFRGASGDPVPLVIVAATDADKAKTSLARLNSSDKSFAYAVVGNDVLLAQHTSDLTEAQQQASAQSLPAAGSYAADVATLPKGSLVTMWADLDRITAAAKSALAKTCGTAGSLRGGCSAFNLFGSAGGLGGLSGTAFKGGRIVLGVSVDDKVATMTVRAIGHKASTSSVIGDEISSLPADTTGALAFGDVSSGLSSAMKSLGSLGGLTGLATGSSDSASASSGAVPPAFPSLNAAAMKSAEAAMKSAEAANPALASAFPSGFPTAFPSAPVGDLRVKSSTTVVPGFGGDPTKMIEQGFKAATGLNFPDDLSAILGDRSVIAVGDIPLGSNHIGDLQVGIRSHPKDVSKAQDLAKTLIDHVGQTGIPFKLGTATAGSDFILGSSHAYATALAADGKLGANPQFTAAMGDLSQAHFAAYVDLSKFTGLLAATKEKSLSGFKALGIVDRSDGNDEVVQLKILAG